MSDKPLDCVGTSGPVGKHDFRPLPFPIHRVAREFEPDHVAESVRCVESKPVTPVVIRSPGENLQGVENMLKRARLNGGRMHLQEIETALESLEEVRAVLPVVVMGEGI